MLSSFNMHILSILSPFRGQQLIRLYIFLDFFIFSLIFIICKLSIRIIIKYIKKLYSHIRNHIRSPLAQFLTLYHYNFSRYQSISYFPKLVLVLNGCYGNGILSSVGRYCCFGITLFSQGVLLNTF